MLTNTEKDIGGLPIEVLEAIVLSKYRHKVQSMTASTSILNSPRKNATKYEQFSQ